MAHPIIDWKGNYLRRRGLDCPTGGPLYSYRTTSSEFEDLGQILSNRLAAYLQIASLGDVARHIPFFPALFVLFAAEWWHRRYDGSGWSWDPIMKDLGADAADWTQGQRSECVEKGLQDWRLRLSDTHGLRFLGSIAFQGGLPMQLLASARGKLGQVLGRVLRLASTGVFEAKDVQDWIGSLSTYLPNAYRQTEIFILLAEVILSVLRLKAAAKLTTATGAIEALDRFDPQWRNFFPIPIEDAQAQGLIDQLIRDAADARLSRATHRISVERRLEKVDDAVWQLRSDIELPEHLAASDLCNMFGTESASLTQRLTLRFSRLGQSVEIGLRKLAGQDRYRVERRPLDARSEVAVAEHTMALITGDGLVLPSVVARGDCLSAELPWLMEPVADSTQAFRFLRQGAGVVATRDAVLVVPADWSIDSDEGSEVEHIGSLATQDSWVWRVSGSVRVSDASGQHYRIRCGQAAAVEDHLEWRGTRIWDVFRRPELAYRGVPRLYRVSEEGLAHLVAGTIAWRMPGGRSTLTPNGMVGPIDATWPAEGETKWRSRLVLLPDEASLRIEPGDEPTTGRLRFFNYGLVGAQLESPDVSLAIQEEGSETVLTLKYLGSGSPPEWCNLRLLWRGNPNEAHVQLPFPAKGVRAFAADGHQLADGAILPAESVYGVRMVGFLGTSSYSAEVRLSLHGSNTAASAINTLTRSVKANVGESRVEIRLIDYVPEIQRLLAGTDALDATVSLRLQLGGGLSASLRIARYACELTRLSFIPGVGLPQEFLSGLGVEEIAALPVRALRMDAPGEEPIALRSTFTEGVATGTWAFPVSELSAGPWLIYPGADSKIVFRPMIWLVLSSSAGQLDEEVGEARGLVDALRIGNERLRQESLETVIDGLAEDFVHADWQVIERIAGHLGHLPLSALDLWRCFSRSAEGMAALALRFGTWPTGFVERFSAELPMMWETIPLDVWVRAMTQLQHQCDKWRLNEVDAAFSKRHLERRTEDLASGNPALRVLLELARCIATGGITPGIAFAQQPIADAIFTGQLFDGEECRLQRLLRNNLDAQWPTGFNTEIDLARNDGAAKYLCPTRYGFHDIAINAPLVLAAGVATDAKLGWCRDAKTVRTLRLIQNFDPDWFAEAFDLTVARCLANKAIQLK